MKLPKSRNVTILENLQNSWEFQPEFQQGWQLLPTCGLTMVKTPVKTGLGKTPKTHISWAKLGKTNFLNLRILVVSLFCA